MWIVVVDGDLSNRQPNTGFAKAGIAAFKLHDNQRAESANRFFVNPAQSCSQLQRQAALARTEMRCQLTVLCHSLGEHRIASRADAILDETGQAWCLFRRYRAKAFP